MIDLKERGWINSDKNCKMNSDFFLGTTIQSLRELKGYTVHILFFGMAIPSKVQATFEDATKLESEVWETIQGGGQ